MSPSSSLKLAIALIAIGLFAYSSFAWQKRSIDHQNKQTPSTETSSAKKSGPPAVHLRIPLPSELASTSPSPVSANPVPPKNRPTPVDPRQLDQLRVEARDGNGKSAFQAYQILNLCELLRKDLRAESTGEEKTARTVDRNYDHLLKSGHCAIVGLISPAEKDSLLRRAVHLKNVDAAIEIFRWGLAPIDGITTLSNDEIYRRQDIRDFSEALISILESNLNPQNRAAVLYASIVHSDGTFWREADPVKGLAYMDLYLSIRANEQGKFDESLSNPHSARIQSLTPADRQRFEALRTELFKNCCPDLQKNN
jgi:hypothetical protein